MANQVWLTKDEDGEIDKRTLPNKFCFVKELEYINDGWYWSNDNINSTESFYNYTRADALKDRLAMKFDQFNKQFPEGGAKAFMRVK